MNNSVIQFWGQTSLPIKWITGESTCLYRKISRFVSRRDGNLVCSMITILCDARQLQPDKWEHKSRLSSLGNSSRLSKSCSLNIMTSSWEAYWLLMPAGIRWFHDLLSLSTPFRLPYLSDALYICCASARGSNMKLFSVVIRLQSKDNIRRRENTITPWVARFRTHLHIVCRATRV